MTTGRPLPYSTTKPAHAAAWAGFLRRQKGNEGARDSVGLRAYGAMPRAIVLRNDETPRDCRINVCKLQSSYICNEITNQIKNNEAYNRTKIGNYFRNGLS